MIPVTVTFSKMLQTRKLMHIEKIEIEKKWYRNIQHVCNLKVLSVLD